MMNTALHVAPTLSTPDEHILLERELPPPLLRLSDAQIRIRYEIDKTIQEIRSHRWRRIALQFPDHMLPHSVNVYEQLAEALIPPQLTGTNVVGDLTDAGGQEDEVRLTVLADTSYGSCCADEIAAEHINADVIVHYGRACLSPTDRLPVLHVFTTSDVDISSAHETFNSVFPDQSEKVIVTADLPYANAIPLLVTRLRQAGYTNIVETKIVHDPSALIPNRALPDDHGIDSSSLAHWSLFHIAPPPTALLLTLASKVKSFFILDTTTGCVEEARTAIALRRRYALVTSMNTVATWGILINTLSVKNYLHVVEHVKQQIAMAGKKSYMFVVGKLNAAKVANFSEIGGWVVIGCWESSLIDSRDFFRPILTPFELDLALMPDEKRVWTGTWRSDFEQILNNPLTQHESQIDVDSEDQEQAAASEDESAPPEFDLRTGKYVSRSRPLRNQTQGFGDESIGMRNVRSTAIAKRMGGELFTVNGAMSPAAEFLANKRTWQGLGSEFEIRYEDEEPQGALIEEGRTGVAGGYTVGESLKV